MSTEKVEIFSVDYAASQDAADPLAKFRSEFLIPTLADLKRPTLKPSPTEVPSELSTYLCGNSLGVQPVRTAKLIESFLAQWKTKGVKGHFTKHSDSPLTSFVDADDHAAKLAAPILGALESEVAIMGTLTGNLHLLMSSFYRPSPKGAGRWKIMLEGKAFPSDHFAIESQIQHHRLKPEEAMVLLEPSNDQNPLLKTDDILRKIDENASELALILLPGIQFYTGQFFDIAKITAHAHSHDIPIGWDLAHAAGNVELKMHEWNVDFAAWCNYKYLNSGPGAMAGIFVHERFGKVDMNSSTDKYWPRLTGWWGDDKEGRFAMTNNIQRSVDATPEDQIQKLTAYLEQLLAHMSDESTSKDFTIITSRIPEERGAQLSIRLRPGILNQVMEYLDNHGVIIDERKPDVIRVAPAPLYNNFTDVWNFCKIFGEACRSASGNQTNGLI